MPSIPTVDAARLALAPYLLWLKLAAVLLIVALIFGAGWKAGAGLTEGRWQRAAAKQAADYQATLARAREAERASYAKSNEVSRGLQQDLAAIRAERDRLRNQPVRTVRLYVPAAGPACLPSDRPAAGGRDGATAAAAAPASAAGPDIGRGLYDLTDDGDAREAELAARLTRCQEWAAAGK
jgi:Sec-independent protein translocase protein TatA